MLKVEAACGEGVYKEKPHQDLKAKKGPIHLHNKIAHLIPGLRLSTMVFIRDVSKAMSSDWWFKYSSL